MSDSTVDEWVLQQAPGPTVALHPSVARARKSLDHAMDALRLIQDRQMEYAWDWNGEEADVRYGFYRLYELLEGAAAEVRRQIGADGLTEARAPIAAATAARWEWHGALACLDNADLDEDPGGGEWTVRQTLAHTVTSQRAYVWFTAWWLGLRDAPADEYLKGFPEDKMALFEAHEATDGDGSIDEILARMDELMDRGAARLGLLDPHELAIRARWSGIDVTVGFRLWRWSSHIREHTVQLDKTMAMLRRRPTEAELLMRTIAAAYGHLEAEAFAVPEAVMERGTSGRAAAAVFDDIADLLERHAASVPAAARAAVPVTPE